jgi:DNA-binding SARP family transcriptional activator
VPPRPASVHPPQALELRLLGRFVVVRDGAEIPAAAFGGRKVRSLLRMLACHPGRFHSHDALTDMLWGERPPADPAANLQVFVNRIRRATNEPGLVVTASGGYALRADQRFIVDGESFAESVAACSTMTGREALSNYRSALALFAGEPLAEDRYDDWAQAYRERLNRLHQDALERAAAVAMVCDESALAVEYATAAVAAEPLREVAALTLVRALAATGDQAAALAHYDRYRRALASDLGLDPSPAAEALHAALLQGDPVEGGKAGVGSVAAPAAFRPLRFVGRAAECDAVLAACLPGGSGGVATISGPSGAGKSRLLGEIAGRSAAGVLSLRAYWPERSEPWSLARGLIGEVMAADVTSPDELAPPLRAALASIVPEIEPPVAAIADPLSRRALIFEAAVRLVSAMPATLVMVDDLQWADPSSLLLLAALSERVPGLGMVLAYRPGEVEAGGEVAGFLARLDLGGEVHLSALGADALAELSADPALAAALRDATDGTPLAVAEVLRGLEREGAAGCDAQGRWRLRTSEASSRAAELGALGQRRAIARRLDSHAGNGIETLKLLALVARQVPARILAEAGETSERETLSTLTALSAAGLVRLTDGGWVTAHDMVAEVLAERLPGDERGRLHGLLARALERDGGDPAERARHWRAGGDVARAAEAQAQAARQALDAFADSEAEALADAGLSDPVGPQIAAQLLQVRAQARRRRGDLAGARGDLRSALALHRDSPARATTLAQLATLASGADDLVRASELVEMAILEAGTDRSARAQALEVAAVLDMNLGRDVRAAERSAEALEKYTQLGDSRGAARVLDTRAMAAFFGGDVTGGTRLLHRVANLFEDSGDLMRLVTPRSTRGHGLVFLGQPAAGLADTSAALEIANSLGHPEGQAYALWHRSEALSALGEGDEALAEGRHARRIAEQLGHRGWTATAWRAIGIAEQARGEPERALRAFHESLKLSENLDLFGSWAASRAALAAIALGRLGEAEGLVARALALGPPLGHYESRMARVELSAARGDAATEKLATEARRLAETGGALAHLARLNQLVTGADGPVFGSAAD